MSGFSTFLASAAPWLAETALRATVVLVAAAAVVHVLGRASAALRHAVLVLAASALLVLPFASALLPAWELPFLTPPAAPVAVVPRIGVTLPAARPRPTAREARLNPHLLKAAAGPSAPASVVPPQAAPDAAPLGWLTLLASAAVVVWLAGVAAGLARLAWGAAAIRSVGRRAALVTDDDWHVLLERCAREVGLARLPLLLRSRAVTAAVVYGHRRPVVVLAADADAWPHEQRRAFLLHELAHARRRDVATRTVAEVARAFYWPHPLAWWLVRRQSTEAERACDDRVLGGGIGADDYAGYLLDAARALSALPQPLSVLSVTGRLESRMLAILDPGQRRTPLSGRAWAAGAAASFACLATAAAVEPAPATRPKAPAPAVTAVAPRVPLAGEPAMPRPPAPPVPVVPSADAAPPAAAAPALAPAAPPADVAPVLAPPVPAAPALVLPVPEVPAIAPVLAPPPPLAPAAVVPAPPAPVAAPAAPAPATVIRISTSLVQLDAVVTDRDGRPVTDLTPADFEVVEGDRRRTVTHVTYVRPAEQPGGVLGRRTVVFLVDDLHLSQRGIHETRGLLASFAHHQLAPSDLVTIAKVSDVGKTGLQFASGPAAVLAAAEGIRYSKVSFGETLAPARIVLDDSGSGLERREQTAVVLPGLMSESDAFETSRNSARSVVALKAVVDALRGVPGRKAVVFVSQGFVSALPSFGEQGGRFRRDTFGALDGVYADPTLRAAVRGVTDLANRASVVVYGLDPTGPAHAARSAQLMSLPAEMSALDGSSLATFTSAAINGEREREVRQNGLLDLAVPTGGLVWRDTFNHDAGLARILADQSGYYLVAYEPDATTFARIGGAAAFHDVQVKVRRQGLDVRSRRGFYGVTDEAIAASAPVM